jgi:hypothetical protein
MSGAFRLLVNPPLQISSSTEEVKLWTEHIYGRQHDFMSWHDWIQKRIANASLGRAGLA